MRDKLITLSMRKPNRIKTEHDVQMLVLDDFDTQPWDGNLLRLLGDSTAMSDVATRTTLAKLCIEKVKLCVCIHHILATQYSETIVKMARENMTPDVLMMLTPKQTMSESIEVIKCEQKLDEWNENLPQDCYFRERRISGLRAPDLEVLSLHRAVLNMLYLTASSALHRPHVVSKLSSRQTRAFNLQHLSLERAKEAAVGITDIAKNLHDYGTAKFLPPVGVTVLMPAMMIHLIEIKADPTLENPSMCRFQQCVEILQTLQDIFASADYGYSFVDAAVHKSNIEIVQGTERRRVQGIADLMDFHESVPPRACVGESNQSGSPVLPRPDFATASAGGVIVRANESASVSDGFEAFINFDAFSDSFGAGAGLSVDFNEYGTTTF